MLNDINVSAPDHIDVDDIAPADLRVRIETLTAALTAARVQLLPLCDLADELLRSLEPHLQAAHDRYQAEDEDVVVLNDLDAYVGARALAYELHVINEASDYEAMYHSWQPTEPPAPAPLHAVE